MRDQIVVETVDLESLKTGPYQVQFVKPSAATVSLVSFTQFPMDTILFTTRAYKGIYDLAHHDDYPMVDAFSDIVNTKLQTPLEMIHTLWLLNDVSRAFTHQLVRYRVGTSFIQESMRFLGMKKVFKVLVSHAAANTNPYTEVPDGFHALHVPNFELYKQGCVSAIENYVQLLDRGVPSEDARGTLPTNILTSIYFDCSFRTLQGLFPQRLCCQAQQGEWQPILMRMRELIKIHMGDKMESLLRAPYELGQDCGYRASFDRPCTWQKKKQEVDADAKPD